MRIFPVIRIRIRAGRWVVGNHSLPVLLSAYVRRANLVYAWEPAQFDPYIWLVTGKLTQLKVGSNEDRKRINPLSSFSF